MNTITEVLVLAYAVTLSLACLTLAPSLVSAGHGVDAAFVTIAGAVGVVASLAQAFWGERR